jgi:isoquinoline 1-oxidoreductase alpha subunit
MTKLSINGEAVDISVEDHTPLLWVIRDHVGLTGTKYGCGVAQCGACTVHIDGIATRSCAVLISDMTEGQEILTIEGLGKQAPHAVQEAWADLDIPQCGYCQAGMIMAASALLAQNPAPTDEDIRAEISNICRCGTYTRILAGVKLAAERMAINKG